MRKQARLIPVSPDGTRAVTAVNGVVYHLTTNPVVVQNHELAKRLMAWTP